MDTKRDATHAPGTKDSFGIPELKCLDELQISKTIRKRIPEAYTEHLQVKSCDFYENKLILDGSKSMHLYFSELFFNVP